MLAKPMKATLRSGFLVLAISALAVPASAGPFENGLAAYNRGDYAAALQNWRPLTEAAYPLAQKFPGVMFYTGSGAPTDPSGKPDFWRGVAEQSAADAQFQLGRLYEDGRGVPQDDVRAAAWYRKAAEQGNAGAQYRLGLMYGEGRGVQRDSVVAHMLFNLAAMQGHEEAQKDWDIAASFLAPGQIAEARRMAGKWTEHQRDDAGARLLAEIGQKRQFPPVAGGPASELRPRPVKTIRIGGDGKPKPE